MNNFTFCTPTKVYFGKGAISNLKEAVTNFGTKVLLVYGGGSIKKSGLYDTVLKNLDKCEIFELSGVEPNPRIDSVRAGVELCRKHNIDVVLAVGGGSVLDCSKAICAGVFYEGDAWDLVLDNSKVTEALPLVTVLTLSATGSEFDFGAVISNLQTNEKLALCHDKLFPKASILDPSYTFSVSAYQSAAGAADMMSHIMEQYFVLGSNIISDGLCEAILKTAIVNTKKVLKDPNDYDARAQLMWASSLACNGICSLGNTKSPWVCHGIEHEVSAYYDITHGVGLAIITPHWMRYSLNEQTVDRFCQFAANVFNVPYSDDKFKMANEGIDKLAQFFNEIGIAKSFSELNIGKEHIEDMAKHAVEFGCFDTAIRPLNVADVVTILNNCF